MRAKSYFANVLATSFTTFYAFLRLFDTYSVWANYVCSGLIQENE